MGRLSVFLFALASVPRRTVDCFTDPIRRVHFLVECALVWGGAAQVTQDAVQAATILGAYFGVYEFVLEPISRLFVRRGWPSLVGPYFERGPRTGERFIHE